VLVDPGSRQDEPCDLPPCRWRKRQSESDARRSGRGGSRYGGWCRRRSPSAESFTWLAVVRRGNLWVKDVGTCRETPVTKDGVKDFGYATTMRGGRAATARSSAASPDSKKIATVSSRISEASGGCIRCDTTGGHPARRPEVPRCQATRHHDDPARGHRSRHATESCREDPAAARSASVDVVRTTGPR